MHVRQRVYGRECRLCEGDEDQPGDEAANEGRNGGGPASYIPAHTSPAAAASFRT